MSLPTKALGVLIDFKKELLSREVPSEHEKPKKEKKPTQKMRHARTTSPAWQRFCQRGGNW